MIGRKTGTGQYDPDAHPAGGDYPLFDQTRFAGEQYDPAQDKARLTGQIAAIHALIADGAWRTLREIAEATGYGEASISAQLRNLRKPPHSMTVEKRPRGERSDGLWEYRLA